MSCAHKALNQRRWNAVRLHVFNRDGWRCVFCGKAGRLECDHVTPLEREPGQDPYDPNGLQTLCRACHMAKTRNENRRRYRETAFVPPEVERWRTLVNDLRPA